MKPFLLSRPKAAKLVSVARACLIVAGCLLSNACSRQPEPQEARSTAQTPKPEADAPESARKPQGSAPSTQGADTPSQGPLNPVRPKPAGKPSPATRSGHAVAFAGWRPSKDGTRDVILLCDPGDNAIEGRTLHGWNAKPRELPVYFGRRRPNIVLLPAGVFTITGAVLITAAEASTATQADYEPATATGMPDLSQDLNPTWRGLCGATSGANVLFYMAQNNPEVLGGRPRGPSDEADEGVMSLIVGDRERIRSDSLAGRMGTSEDGSGANNVGLCEGMDSWLAEHDEGGWSATLDWFDDDEKTRKQQQDFFARLASAVRGGGGAILCLWPGTEYSDAAVGEEATTSSSAEVTSPEDPEAGSVPVERTVSPAPDPAYREPLPEAAFPALPPSPTDSGPSLPGRSPAGLTGRAAINEARQELANARTRLERNDPARAFDHVSRAVTLLRQHGDDSTEGPALLNDALALSREVEKQMPVPSAKVLQKRTLFQ